MEKGVNKMSQETIEKVRAAIKDRAVWFALLFAEFEKELGTEKTEALARRAIFEFGKMKAAKDRKPFSHREWVGRHEEKGSAQVFDSQIDRGEDKSVQKMRHCALVDAWKEMGLPPERVAKYCDIAMDGDRGRAAAHGIKMELYETLGSGDAFCRLIISDK